MAQPLSLLAAMLGCVAVLLWPTRRAAWRLGSSARPRARARSLDPPIAEVLEHIALALQGGAGLQPALRQVASGTPGVAGEELAAVAAAMAWGVDDESAWANAPSRWDPARRALLLASRSGVGPSALLSAAAADLRRDALAKAERDTARLAVLLVLPLGLAFLPAFVLTTVVPVVIALATRVIAGG